MSRQLYELREIHVNPAAKPARSFNLFSAGWALFVWIIARWYFFLLAGVCVVGVLEAVEQSTGKSYTQTMTEFVEALGE